MGEAAYRHVLLGRHHRRRCCTVHRMTRAVMHVLCALCARHARGHRALRGHGAVPAPDLVPAAAAAATAAAAAPFPCAAGMAPQPLAHAEDALGRQTQTALTCSGCLRSTMP